MRYICQICGHIYDDAKEKTPFAKLPDTWRCPLCGAAKSDFKPEGVKKEAKEEAEEAAQEAVKKAVKKAVKEVTKEAVTSVSVQAADAELKELSAGQLAALCSNLARGCEKQYKTEESSLFKQLADYFTAITPAVSDATVESVAKLLQEDITNYPAVRATADAAGDRGAARICVWGEKVTRMLSSLVERYLKEGEPMLEGTHVWVCTVCGFVYIGDNAPAFCPVCKVPAWKFEKIEGRA